MLTICYSFNKQADLHRHIQMHILERLKVQSLPSNLLRCPIPACQEQLDSVPALANHIVQTHAVYLFGLNALEEEGNGTLYKLWDGNVESLPLHHRNLDKAKKGELQKAQKAAERQEAAEHRRQEASSSSPQEQRKLYLKERAAESYRRNNKRQLAEKRAAAKQKKRSKWLHSSMNNT